MADDFSKLAADLEAVPERSAPFLRKAVEVTARNVRDTARENAPGSAGGSPAKHFPKSITYDIKGSGSRATGSQLEAVIGPDKDRPQGALGNLIEYGSPKNAPYGTMHGALQENEADFERGIAIAIADSLKGLGL